jgi:myo-inositol-1(or 4)-monophosphatase
MTTVDFAAFVEKLADVAADTILPFFRTALRAEDKNAGGMFDPVTEADRAAEAAMRRLIQATFPHHGIIGEEFGPVQSEAEYVWVLDPIDGTKSFISGFPLFGSLIALTQGARAVLGIIEAPAMSERWVGIEGQATLCNGAPAHVSGCTSIEHARVYSTTTDAFDAERLRRYDAYTRRASIRRYGGDCYLYGLLAAGHCDLVIEAAMKPHDFQALVPVVEGAGGRISDWSGRPLDAQSGDSVLAAATQSLWAQAVEALAGG